METGIISVSGEVDDEIAKTLVDGLTQFNESLIGPDNTKTLWIVSRDEQGSIDGGLQGFTQWDWFIIGLLWVKEAQRGRGVGRRLLAKAEETANERGCRRLRVATMSFQAPGFYERFGYREVCRLPDAAPGHSYIWMDKVLSV